MKTYNDYKKEYVKDVYESLKKRESTDVRVVEEDVYISMKWQLENNWNPWDKDSEERLTKLYQFDEDLFWSVFEGTKKLMQIVNGKEGILSVYFKRMEDNITGKK